MPNIQAEARPIGTEMVTHYRDGVGVSLEIFNYPEPQTKIEFENTGKRRIFLTVDGVDITLAPGDEHIATNSSGISMFSIRAEFGYQSFEAKSYRPKVGESVEERIAILEERVQTGGIGGGGSIPSNVILFESWTDGEVVTIDTSTEPAPDIVDPILTITAGGTFSGTKNVSMSTNETATIYYTTDGSTPTVSSSVYTGTLSFSSTTTLKAFAVDTSGNRSTVQTVTYTYDNTAPADTTAPVLTITSAATFTDTQTVNMSTNETATIWYTLDDSDPVTSGTRLQYTSPLTLTATDTIKAYAVDTTGNVSVVQTVTYTKETTPMAGTVVVSDTFDRVDSTSLGTAETGQTWQNLSGVWGISGNQAYLTANNSTGTALVDAGTADCQIQVTYAGTFASSVKVVARCSDINNQIVFNADGTISRIQAGTWTLLGTTTIPKSGDIIKMTLKGNDITVQVNDSEPLTVTDSFNNTVTKHGFRAGTSAQRFDNFKILTV